MLRIWTAILSLAAVACAALPAQAQGLMIIGQDSFGRPICAGPMGPAPCALLAQQMQSPPPMLPPLQQIGMDPQVGPICAGPLGPGPCAAIADYLLRHYGSVPMIVPSNVPNLMQIANDPALGPICAGPLGPGPCDSVRAYLARLNANSRPIAPDIASIEVVAGVGSEAFCKGPFGTQPCSIIQQEILESGRGPTIPELDALRRGEALDAVDIARECADRAGIDVINFSSCTGGKIILSSRQQDILSCATESSDTKAFATCAAPLMGANLNPRQRRLADCAAQASSNSEEFIECAGGAMLDSKTARTIRCYRDGGGTETIAACVGENLLEGHVNERQRQAISCLVQANSNVDRAQCAADQADLSEDQRTVISCATESDGTSADFVSCIGLEAANKYLGRDARTALSCAMDGDGSSEGFVACSAAAMLGDKASKEQRIALQCAADSGGDIEQAAVCTGANFLNMQMGLNPEQQIAVQCLVSSGGQPYAAAGCMATRLTARELTKCFTDGIGGDGCFGDNNDLVGKDGWVARTLRDVGGGPNSVFNNPDQIWGGDNSFVRNPGQIWGGDNSFVRNPGQIWGGPNSVFNNPQQLAPEPLQLGKIGGHRICLPWC